MVEIAMLYNRHAEVMFYIQFRSLLRIALTPDPILDLPTV